MTGAGETLQNGCLILRIRVFKKGPSGPMDFREGSEGGQGMKKCEGGVNSSLWMKFSRVFAFREVMKGVDKCPN